MNPLRFVFDRCFATASPLLPSDSFPEADLLVKTLSLQ